MKSCKNYQKWLTLYALDELNEDERQQLEKHIESCPICAVDLQEDKILFDKFSKTRFAEPRDDLLAQCRTELRYRLVAEWRKGQSSMRQPLFESLNSFVRPRLAFAGVVFALFFGIVIGHYAIPTSPVPESEEITSKTENERILNIRNLRIDPATNEIEVELSTVKDIFVCGNLDDMWIRKALVFSLQDQNAPGMRIRAVNALSTASVRGNDIEAALIYVIENDQNSGVRLKAAKVLKNMPINEQIKNAFIRILLWDTNPAVRIEAVDALSRIEEESVKPAMQKAARRDENEYVRLKASNTLERLEKKPGE